MTVCGLPQSLEKCLGSLLQDNTLTSWKIFSNDGGHTVTLRLHPQDTTTRHGEQGEQKHTSIAGGWYRKGEAKVKRDRERWNKYQERLKCDSRYPYAGEKPVNDSDSCCSKNLTNGEVCSGVSLVTEADIAKKTTEQSCQTSAEASTFDKEQSLLIHDGCMRPTNCTDTTTNDTANKLDRGGCVDKCKQAHTPSPPNTIPGPDRTTQQHGDNTRPAAPLASVPDARDSRTTCSDNEMEVASGDGAEGGSESEGESEGSDTGDNQDTETERDDAQSRELIVEKVKNADCSELTLNLLRHKDRNERFQRVVVDRRGKSAPTLICFSNDVILTMDMGTYEKDFHIMERRSAGTGTGDTLHSSCILWPDIDRGGDYKDYIDELKGDLAWAMEITRNLLPERKSLLP